MARGSMFRLKDDSAEANLQWPAPAHKGGEAHHIEGVWNTQDASAIPFNALTDAKNVNFRGEQVNRRTGIATALTSALTSPVRSFHWAQDNTGAHQWFLAFANKTAYSLTGSVGSMTATDTTGGFSVDAAVQCYTYLGKVYAVNGTDALSAFDLTAGTWGALTKHVAADNDFDNAKLSKYITGSHDMIVVGGSSAAPQTVYICDQANGPTYFPSGQEVTVDTNDGQPITGLLNVDDWIVVFKSRSMHSLPPLYPQAAKFQRYLVSPSHGCPSSRSAKVWEQGYMLFQSQDGHVYAFSRGGLNKEFVYLTKLTANLNATVSGFTAAQIAASWAVIHDGYYKLYCGGVVLVLDLLQSNLKQGSDGCVWALYKYENVDQPVLFCKPDDLTLWGGGSGNQVWRHDWNSQYYDGDTSHPVDWYANTGIWDLGRPEMFKLFDRTWVYVTSQTGNYSLNFGIAYDFSPNPALQPVPELGPGFLLGTSKLGPAGDPLGTIAAVTQRLMTAQGQAKRLQLRFKRNNGAGPETIRGVTIYYVPLYAA